MTIEIKKEGIAGTLESSDIMIHIEKNPGTGIEIKLKSTVENQFGRQIRKVIRETLENSEVTDALVEANDKGALDCTIKARVMMAVSRAAQVPCRPWEVK